MKSITYLIFALFLSSLAKIQAQCNEVVTVTICDMTTIDGDGDGTPDGIINLYDQYNAIPGGISPISLSTGTWFDPSFNFALDETTGNLSLWDLDNASEGITDYQFVIENGTCGSDPLITLNIIVGPFSGVAIPTTGTNDVNVEVCDSGLPDPCGSMTNFDLFTALLSTPTAHANGTWRYEGSSPNFIGIIDNRILQVDIPYTPGVPLVDDETFELIYSVPGIGTCSPTVETRVKISAIREVSSGAANRLNICETELIAGDFDAVIDLRGDAYLVNEDIEGVWLFETDPTGQLTGLADSEINLREVYNNLYQSNPRFGCITYGYSYFVESRSAVCSNKTSTVSFTFFEYLRPFQQVQPVPEFCVGDSSLSSRYNLNDLLEFTTENGVLYSYPPSLYTSWRLVSGNTNLNLNNNGQGVIDLQSITNADAGTYVFEYRVSPEYNCVMTSGMEEIIYEAPNGCDFTSNLNHPCRPERAQVTITIHPKLYAGENTSGLQFCENDPVISAPLNLFTLLNTNGIDDPIYQGPLGTWTDNSNGQIITNPTTYVIPIINNQQLFSFNYTTVSPNRCLDRADLSFTVFEEYQAGISTMIDVCDNNTPLDLFDRLGGSPNANGTWTGPNGYASANHIAIFDPLLSDAGVYTYTVPDNVNASGTVICAGNLATVTVTLHQSPNAGDGGLFSVCRSELQIDLVDYLGTGANSGGTFIDVDNTNVLTGSLLDVSQLVEGRYNFRYEIQGHPSCLLSTTMITISIVEVDAPITTDQTFCITDGATIDNLIVNNGQDFNWYDTATSTIPLSINTVLINGEDYFVAAVDSDGCESPRISMIVTLLSIANTNCIDCIKDGISVNGDGENDEFTLCRLPVVFPDFEINIFNRYGSKVYKGNKNTPFFNGSANVPLTMGEVLPSGVYFYIFDPKDGETKPFQGNFYLSR